jgi:nucleoside 2-deoxyribosyltransferase
MDNISEICIVGDIVIDITLKQYSVKDTKLRLGGITHAARGLWATDANYSIGHINPQYFDEQISNFLTHHGCLNTTKLGNVEGAPYIFLIKDVKEVGDQGYEFILRDELNVKLFVDRVKELKHKGYKDILFISGNYSIDEIASELSTESNYHIDLTNNVNDLSCLNKFPKKLSTIFISTSSLFFHNNYRGDFTNFANLFSAYADRFVLKENRGGSRAIDFQKGEIILVPSQTRPIQNSVGIGDVFDSAYIFNYRKNSFDDSLNISSWIAAEYAATTYPDNFKTGVKRILSSNINELKQLGGINLAWEDRKLINIYIAGPDFEFINTVEIDNLCNCLLYHNFNPRRPIKENGLMEINASYSRKQELFEKDMKLMDVCHLLVAVLINNDPGTLIEIGLASAKGIPTIVYDPYNQAANCILTQLPDLMSNDLDEIIAEVFIIGSNIKLK